jgi:hypothetical protein
MRTVHCNTRDAMTYGFQRDDAAQELERQD